MATTDTDPRLPVAPLSTIQYEALVRQELATDLGSAGDITTNAIVGADATAHARIVARQDGRVCGLGPALCAFFLLGPVRQKPVVSDGADVKAGATLVELQGSATVSTTARVSVAIPERCPSRFSAVRSADSSTRADPCSSTRVAPAFTSAPSLTTGF